MENEIKLVSVTEIDWRPTPEFKARLKLAKELAVKAKELDAPPQYHCAKTARGDKGLSKPIYWRGRQWAVTSLGIECLTYYYPIENHRYDEDEPGYGWLKHLAEKPWVDLPDFAEALRIARKVSAGHTVVNGAKDA